MACLWIQMLLADLVIVSAPLVSVVARPLILEDTANVCGV